MKQFYKTYVRGIALFALSAILFSGCDSNSNGSNIGSTASGGNPYFSGVKAATNANNVELRWNFDGHNVTNGFNIYDMAWHLVTITVINQDTPLTTPIAIKGLQADIYPKPTDHRGESVEIQDVNCNTALFSKNGDSCSAYVRTYYDLSTGTSNPPTIPAQLATNAYNSGEAGMLDYYQRTMFQIPSGDFRAIQPIETKYYVGSAVKSNPMQYSILDMRNVSYPPLSITTLSDSTNPDIKLMNRQSAESNDPYYGSYNQCSLTANPALKQVNYLSESTALECILVYQAAPTSTDAIESTTITLLTNIGIVAPWTISDLKLVANYVNGTPIQPYTQNGSSFIVSSGSATPSGTDMKMITDGVLSSGTIDPSPDPFKLVNISYAFKPNNMERAPYGIPYYQNGVINVADQYRISIPSAILTDASTTNPVTVGSFAELVAGGTANGSASVTACGGAWASSSAQIVTGGPTLANNYSVRLIMDNDSDSSCGGETPSHFEENIHISGYNATVYSNDQQGCGGNNWDMGAKITVNSQGCSGDNCTYRVDVTASHGGIGNQCHDTQTRSYYLNFLKPVVYTQFYDLHNFNNPTSKQPTFVGSAGQNMNAMLGTQGGVVAQTMTCGSMNSTNKYPCNAQGLYSNGLSATSMLYNIGLKAGDYLANGTVAFTRSDGYDLSNFIASY